MGGRGTFAAGKQVPYSFQTVGWIEVGNQRIKVLQGLDGRSHKLPEEAHSSYAYALLNRDGTLRTLRFYDSQHRLRYEIAKHRERNIDPSGLPVLHYHVYDITGKDAWHGTARKVTKAMRRRYGNLFERSWR